MKKIILLFIFGTVLSCSPKTQKNSLKDYKLGDLIIENSIKGHITGIPVELHFTKLKDNTVYKISFSFLGINSSKKANSLVEEIIKTYKITNSFSDPETVTHTVSGRTHTNIQQSLTQTKGNTIISIDKHYTTYNNSDPETHSFFVSVEDLRLSQIIGNVNNKLGQAQKGQIGIKNCVLGSTWQVRGITTLLNKEYYLQTRHTLDGYCYQIIVTPSDMKHIRQIDNDELRLLVDAVRKKFNVAMIRRTVTYDYAYKWYSYSGKTNEGKSKYLFYLTAIYDGGSQTNPNWNVELKITDLELEKIYKKQSSEKASQDF